MRLLRTSPMTFRNLSTRSTTLVVSTQPWAISARNSSKIVIPGRRSNQQPDPRPPQGAHSKWMGKNGKLTPAEIEEFLAGPMVARIATIDENGVPYVTPVWQEWDGEAFWIVPRERSAWVAHIKKNPNVGISCAQDSGTYKRVTAQGKAEIVFGPAPMQGQCLDVANRMALRFLGEHGPEYLVPTYDRPRYLIKIVPTKMLTWDGIEWAKKYTDK